MSIQKLYRIHGKSNIQICANGAVYRRSKEANNWVFLFFQEVAQ